MMLKKNKNKKISICSRIARYLYSNIMSYYNRQPVLKNSKTLRKCTYTLLYVF